MAFTKNIKASRIEGLISEIATLGGLAGSGTLNYIPKFTPNGSTLGVSSIFDNGTNVGIGTITPGNKLVVYDATAAGTTTIAVNSDTGNSALNLNAFLSGYGTSGGGIINFNSNGTQYGKIFTNSSNTRFNINSLNGYALLLQDGTTSNVNINASYGVIFGDGTKNNFISTNAGNVGIGENFLTPTSRLHIRGVDVLSTTFALKVDNGAVTPSPLLYVRNDGFASINGTSRFSSEMFNVNGVIATNNNVFIYNTNSEFVIKDSIGGSQLAIQGYGTKGYSSIQSYGGRLALNPLGNTVTVDIGNFGVGVTNPNGLIHFKSTLNTYLTNALLIENVDNLNLLNVKNDGSVGINIASPTAKLHVKGFDSTSSNFALKLDNGVDTPLLYVRNDGFSSFNNGDLTISTVGGNSIIDVPSYKPFKLRMTGSYGDFITLSHTVGDITLHKQTIIVGSPTPSNTNTLEIGNFGGVSSVGVRNISLASSGSGTGVFAIGAQGLGGVNGSATMRFTYDPVSFGGLINDANNNYFRVGVGIDVDPVYRVNIANGIKVSSGNGLINNFLGIGITPTSKLHIDALPNLVITETFGTTNAVPVGWVLVGDFVIDPPFASGGVYADCNVVGSSGNSKLLARDFYAGVSTATYTFSTTGYSNIQVKWNAYLKDLGSLLVVKVSNDGFVSSTTLTPINPTVINTWTAVPIITLPISFNYKQTVSIRFEYTSVSPTFPVLIDDLIITGESIALRTVTGKVIIDDLIGAGTRTVKVDANGKLVASASDLEVSKADKQNGLVSGGAITVGTFGGTGTLNDIRVASAVWFITPSNYTTGNTDFLDIVLSVSGFQRFVGLYGTNTNTIVKVDGVESEYAVYPTTPANHALIGYVLVTDSSSTTTPDLSGYMLVSNKATAADLITGTNNTLYMTASVMQGIVAKYQNLTTPSQTILTTNVSNFRDTFSSVTALTSAMSISAPTGTPTNGTKLWYRFKDNNTARALTWNPIFVSRGGIPPTTTVSGKVINIGYSYNSAVSTWDCVAVSQEV